MKRRLLIYLLLLLSVAATSQAVSRDVRGVMIDSESGETLPFSNVYVRRTLIGTQTDIDGRFALTLPAAYDTLWFNAMGYTDQFLALGKLSRRDSTLVIRMTPSSLALDEIMVTPDDAPHRLLKSVLANKNKNNPANHERTEYEKYTRWEYSLANISDRASNSLLLKNTQSLMQVTDDGDNRYLPVYFSETLSRNEYQREPRKAKATIIADRTKGIDVFKQYEIGGFSSAMDNDLNFYDDVIKILGAGFVSPIARDCFRYYDYFIEDSTTLAAPAGDSIKVYHVKFRPQTTGNKAFYGTMDIETRRFSPVRIDCEMAKGTNINFVKELRLSSTFQMVADTVPFYSVNEMDVRVDYMPVNSDKKRLEIRCYMYNSQTDVRLDMPDQLELSKRAMAIETVKAYNYRDQDDDFWDSRRHAEMSDASKAVSATIDSINNVRSIKTFNYVAKAAMTGFVDVGGVEIGPVGEMFNTNKIEGVHLGVGLRTSKELSENWVFSEILGYGFKNKRTTFGAGVGYKFRSPLRRTVDLYYDNRLIKIGEDENILYLYENMLSTSETNLVAQIFKRESIDELFYVSKLRLRYDHEWLTGFQTRLEGRILTQDSPKYYPFTQGGKSISHVYGQEVSVDFRLSFREKFIDDGLQRVYMSTDYPIVHFVVAGGHTKVGTMHSSYARLHSTLKHTFRLGQTHLDMAVENGIYFGRLPYTMLNIARGNKTYGFYRYDFNLMNYLAFVLDRYFYVHADYQLDGKLLNKVPLLRRLGLREVIGAKLMVGALSSKQQTMLDLPSGVGGPTEPYLEANIGLDNILRFFRVDYIYRVVGDGRDGAPQMGVRVQLNIKL